MIGPQTSARRVIAVVCTALLIAVTGSSILGQSPREWRDYAGGPDSSRFVAATQITKANVSQLQVAWTYAGRPDRFQSARRARRRLRPWAERLVRRARRGDRKTDLDSRGRPGLQQPRRQLLGEQGRQGSPADFQHGEHPPGDSTRRPARAIPSFGINGQVDLRVGLDRDPSTINQQSRTPGRVFENLLIIGLGDQPGVRDRRPATSARSTCAPGSSSGRSTPCRGRASSATTPGRPTRGRPSAAPTTGASSRSTRSAASSTCPTGEPEVQLLRRQPERRQSLRRLPHRARRQNRQAALAFPDGPPRHLGSRQQLGAAVDDHPPERPGDRRRRDGQQDRLPLRVRSRHGQADLADRGTAGAAEDRRCRVKRCRRRSRFRPPRRRSRARSSRPTI